ncbi:hypothetical protein ACJZ2D_008852 [Fusarium nematophilum]
MDMQKNPVDMSIVKAVSPLDGPPGFQWLSLRLSSRSLTCASDRLLERLLCTMPRSLPFTARFDQVDAFGTPLCAIENLLFGADFGRLRWSTDCSLLSRSKDLDRDRVGVDPTLADPEVQHVVQAARVDQAASAKVFTLLDTFNMQVTLFEAVRPPTCLFLCGVEGGRQRAVACSYDEQTRTMFCETVFRILMETQDKMDIVSNFRIGIRQETPGGCVATAGL